MSADSPRPLVRACAWSGALCLIGACIAITARLLSHSPAGDPTVPHATNFYLYTFARFEPLPLCLAAAFLLLLGLALKRGRTVSGPTGFFASPKLPLLAAALVLVAACVGRFAVDQNFDLCIDECLNNFEVRILAHHHLLATVPPEWRDFAPALSVPYQNYRADSGTWASGFLPGFATLQFLLDQMGLDWAVSPLLAAASVLLLAAVARRVFPEQPALAANIAVLLLAVSPQFLAMALTKFAWTAQLGGMLLWVWLLTHPSRVLFLLTPVLGAALIGLHQPHVHPLVAAPFVLRFLYTRQWKIFAWFAAWYLAGAWAWFQVYEALRPHALGGGGDLSNLNGSFSLLPAVISVIFATCHAVTLLAWATPMAVPLLGLFIATWRRQPAVARDGLLGAVLTFAFYLLFFPHPQGNGWGYRYLHAAYGLLALAAAGGALSLVREGWNAGLSRALAASVVFSLMVQAPWRAYEIVALVRPMARTWAFIESRPTDFVVVKTGEFWYAGDLIRNDPWLVQKPLVFNADKLSAAQFAEIESRGSVTLVGAAEVKDFGVILSDPKKGAKKSPK